MREFILNEIKRLAVENDGVPPGVATFANATGITMGKWRGVYWARWSDALTEAGFTANVLVGRRNSDEVLQKVAELCRILGKMPTHSDMRLRVKSDPSFPNDKTVTSHFGGISELTVALRRLATNPDYADLIPLLPDERISEPTHATRSQPTEGFVYMLKSGSHYKIGRTDNIERRIREISIALPESTALIHAIKTDDPIGIESYWHKRFADRRAKGEWFSLSVDDVKAFRRRTFQ